MWTHPFHFDESFNPFMLITTIPEGKINWLLRLGGESIYAGNMICHEVGELLLRFETDTT